MASDEGRSSVLVDLTRPYLHPPPSPIDAPPHSPMTTDLNGEELLFSTSQSTGLGRMMPLLPDRQFVAS